MTESFKLICDGVSKSFIKKIMVFSDINLDLGNGEIKGIAGHNGSGKTTLLKIISGLIQPSGGSVTLTVAGSKAAPNDYYKYFSCVAPYLNVYEEFTPLEHASISSRLKGTEYHESAVNDMLKKFGLFSRRNDLIKTFSSGMKQRIKYLIALNTGSSVLLLDEPFTNLDDTGIGHITELIGEFRDGGGGVIIASNDAREKALCSEIIDLKVGM